MDTHPIYCVNKGLNIIPSQVLDQFNLMAVRKDGCYQSRALIRGKGTVDQSFPVGVTTREDTVKLTMNDRNEWETDGARGVFEGSGGKRGSLSDKFSM